MRAWLPPAVVAALVLAGCADAPVERPAGVDATPTEVEAPVWSIGDWWTYDISGSGPVTWVVTEDLGSDWMVDVDDAAWAFDHAAFAQISTIGRVSKAHLDGSQEDGAVHFFDFPLAENKTWSLTWDGMAWQARAVDVAGSTVEIRAENERGALRVYIFDAEKRWFRLISGYDENGTLQYEARLTRSGHDYDGTFARWTIHSRVDMAMVPGGFLFEQFTVPSDATDLWYGLRVVCNPGGVEGENGFGIFEVHPGDEAFGGVSRHDVCPLDEVDSGTLDPHPGSWGVTGLSAGVALEATFIPRTLVVGTL